MRRQRRREEGDVERGISSEEVLTSSPSDTSSALAHQFHLKQVISECVLLFEEWLQRYFCCSRGLRTKRKDLNSRWQEIHLPVCADRREAERSRDRLTGLSRQQPSRLDIKQHDGWRVRTVLKGCEMECLAGNGTFKVFTYLSAQIKFSWSTRDTGRCSRVLPVWAVLTLEIIFSLVTLTSLQSRSSQRAG